MMRAYKEVSLGFSEFVSQLVHETFDAILSSQNYQLEKYAEIQSKVDMDNDLFRQLYISDDDLDQKSMEFFGYKIESQMKVDSELKAFVEENFEIDSNLIYAKKLTHAGFDAIRKFIADLLIDEQKSILQALLNVTNATKLIVDSGEIMAKLELANIYSSKQEADLDIQLGSKVNPLEKSNRKIDINSLGLTKLRGNLKVEEIVDASTGLTTIVLDKESLNNVEHTTSRIPDVRMVVKPTKMNSTSELFSQVTLKFKTV